MNRSRLLSAAAAGALLASGALGAEPLKIGASLPLTGNFSVSGEKHRQGYQLCVDLINERGGVLGREIDLVVSDNRSDAATSINQYERFLNVDGVEAVYGTFSSKLSFPVASLLAKNDMVHPLPAGGALRIYSQGHEDLFYFQPNAAEYIGASLAGLIRDRLPDGDRPATAAVIHADDFFANGVAAGLLGQEVVDPADGSVVADLAPGFLAELGIETVLVEKWPEEGFNDWLNLANSVKGSDAELVVGLTASAEEAVQLTRALKTVRAEPKLVYFSQGTQAEYAEGVGTAGDGVLVHTSWHPDAPFEGELAGEPFSNADFVAAFEERFGTTPDEDSAIPFAVCQGIEQAIRGVGSTDNTAIGDWLSARTYEEPVRTVLGRFAWDERGLPADKPFLMTQWQGGELEFVYPTDEFEGVAEVSYPKSGW